MPGVQRFPLSVRVVALALTLCARAADGLNVVARVLSPGPQEQR